MSRAFPEEKRPPYQRHTALYAPFTYGCVMGWDYLLNGSGGKPWSKRSASERYENKADRAAKARQVAAEKRAQAVATADALARKAAGDLAKGRTEAGAAKATGQKRGPHKGAAVHVSTSKALANKYGPTGRPPASEIGPRLAKGPAVAPAPIGYSQMRAKQQAAAAAAARSRKPGGNGAK